jgi:hypothetical protein
LRRWTHYHRPTAASLPRSRPTARPGGFLALAQRPVDSSRAPVPDSPQEREIVGRFAEAVERGDTNAVVALLADDAWVTMPPYRFAYQGREAITLFLDDRARLRGAPLRVVPTRANGQSAFGCYHGNRFGLFPRLRRLTVPWHAILVAFAWTFLDPTPLGRREDWDGSSAGYP